MDKAIVNFIQALRHHGLPISPAETLDAINATAAIGVTDQQRLKNCLSMTLAKTIAHRGLLENLFEQFFLSDQYLPNGIDFTSDNVTNHKVTSNNIENTLTAEQYPTLNIADFPFLSSLARQLFYNETAALHQAIVNAAQESGAQEMKIFLQKKQISMRILTSMGDRDLQQELLAFQVKEQYLDWVATLQQLREQLIDRVNDYVEQQYLLYSGKKGEQLSQDILYKVKLTHIDHIQQQQMARLIQKVAKKLASLHSRRRRANKRGLLDVRKTIAANAAFDGYLFRTHWKSTRIERPKVMVICDVSGSVSSVAQFLLMLVYSLQDVLPKARSFVFSNELAEVTNCFRDYEMGDALSLIMERWANRSTDYGRALTDFSEIALKDVDHKTQIIMLGDARNNNDDGCIDIWKTLYTRAQRVLWLNPENRSTWNSGDSIMYQYTPYCSMIEPCNSLRDLERVLGRLLKYAT